MKPSLQLRISQQLALTPQLQQSIKLLQLSTLELNVEIERMLLENPLLEREDSDYDADSWGHTAEAAPATATTETREEAPAATDERPDFPEAASDWGEGNGSGNGSSRDDDDDTDFQEFRAAQTSLRTTSKARLR